MRRYALAGIVLMSAALAVGCGSNSEDAEVFDAVLTGEAEVPARSTAASGRSQIVIEGGVVHYSIEVDDLSSITQSHIHTGSATVAGPVRVFLFQGSSSTTEKRTLASGSFNASNVLNISYEQLLADIRSGNAYVNVHTTTFPGGEIRGQLRKVN